MRARNIKPGLFKNAELADAGVNAQLLFIGLWTLADREGRLKDQPRVIKGELFPYYDFDINGGLTVLERLGHICRYKVEEMLLIEVLNFKKHQSPHNTEKRSTLPAREMNFELNQSLILVHGEPTVIPPLRDGEYRSDSLIHGFSDSLIQSKNSGLPPAPAKPNKVKASRRQAIPEFHQEVIDAYHANCPDLAAVKDWTAKRAKALDTRVSELTASSKPAGTVQYWTDIFRKVDASDWHCGRGKWKACNIDWILKAENLLTIREWKIAMDRGRT